MPEERPLFRLLQEDFDARVDPEADIVVCGPFGRRPVGHTGAKVFRTGEPSPYSRAAYDFWMPRAWREVEIELSAFFGEVRSAPRQRTIR